MSLRHVSLIVLAAAALGGCSRPAPPAAPVVAAGVPGNWLGRWPGPEGTYLEVAGGPGTYDVTVRNLDGPRRFDAKAGSGTLVFVRDGVTETIRAGDGTATGMKWLAGKRDCLVVKPGEGYCRD